MVLLCIPSVFRRRMWIVLVSYKDCMMRGCLADNMMTFEYHVIWRWHSNTWLSFFFNAVETFRAVWDDISQIDLCLMLISQAYKYRFVGVLCEITLMYLNWLILFAFERYNLKTTFFYVWAMTFLTWVLFYVRNDICKVNILLCLP